MKKKQKSHKENIEFAVVTYLFLFLFLGMIGYFIYFMEVESDSFIDNPYNSLQTLFSKHVKRGEIRSADGQVLAMSIVDSAGNEARVYPYGNMFAHVVGYTDQGKTGLEKQENFTLLRSHVSSLEQIVHEFAGTKSDGDHVVTTLNCDLQQVVYDALGENDGAVIVMEPSTGKILSMVSKPDFNPNTIARDWQSIISGGSSELFNRATQGQYTPGSVFKIFTVLEYYREHPDDYGEYSYRCKSSFTFDGQTIHCSANKRHGQQDLMESFAHSCNSSFANLSLSLDLEQFQTTCEDLLFGQDLPLALESSKSKCDISGIESSFLTMATAIGQGTTVVSPLHMALVISAIDNNGVLMRPYLVDHSESTYGDVIEQNAPSEYAFLLSEDECRFLQEYLRAVVTDGTGSKLNSKTYTAYGKTGTAQISDVTDETNAWFVGYAKQDGYEDIAVAVVVEKGVSGSKAAVPVAQKIFDHYFQASEGN